MNNPMPVSVVIPCYRCVKTLARSVASVAAQTSLPAEVILVDDGSGDDTRLLMQEIAREYAHGWIRLVVLSQNVGAASARNAGWAIASQPYVAFLDADDAWHPKKIEVQYGYMAANPNVVLSGHGHRLLPQNALPDWSTASFDVQSVGKWALLLSNQFVTPSVMLQRDVRPRFKEKQRHMEDHMLWLEICFSGAQVVKLRTDLAAVYKRQFGVQGLSAQLWLMERGELGNYRSLYCQGMIKGYQFAMLSTYSAIKYVRRLLVYWGHLRWKK
ncbi:glycosyltransferase family 2 protein [Rhodoferax sp. BLA1]|uniref:glycosyltransferase family 2 protein n=1 Tax=Rhodoferax sp. BLA1 TaxID=2576062 RepID=UPI0015D267AF|nr:glycosyltransferase family 2 protein [Rhodoferax sp. BLA1]